MWLPFVAHGIVTLLQDFNDFSSKAKYLETLINWNVLKNKKKTFWNVFLCFSLSGMYHGTVQ